MNLLLSSRKYVFSLSSISHKYWLLPSTASSLSNKHAHLSPTLSLSASNKCRFLSSTSSSSSSSSSSDQCKHFFPSFYNGYASHRIDWFYSTEPPHPPRRNRDLVDEELKKVFDASRMNFPDLGKVYLPPHDFPKKNNGEELSLYEVREETVDVASFLSAYGDGLVRIGANSSNTDFVKAESLRGKYVLICAAFIPLLWIDKDASHWRQLSLLLSELSQTHIGSNFEIVIVARMRDGWEDNEIVFNHFYSAFPGCLAVPFTHEYRRDYISKCVSNFRGNSSFVLVDPSQNKLLDCIFNIERIVEYGIRGFPFTEDRLDSLRIEDQRIRPLHRPEPPCNLTLEGLLSCESNPASSLLCKFNSEETISVAQLNKNHVGLYLFRSGDKLKQIHDIYRQCKDDGLDFEIVLVPLPYTYSIHPKDFHDIVHNAINKFQIPNWWFLPFNNSAYIRLYNLSGLYNDDDVVIIVGPHNEFVDEHAGENIIKFSSYFGTQAYPFTEEALVHAFLRKLENLTLESFLGYDNVYQDCECDESKMVPVKELKGKNVLVYMDIPLCLERPWTQYEQVLLMFNKIKKVDPDFEMVFAPVLFSVPESEYSKLCSTAKQCILESKMKWFIRPFDDPKHSEIVRSQDALVPLESCSLPSSVLAFGKDGRLLSLDAIRLYWRHGLDPFSSLPESMSRTLSAEIWHRMFQKIIEK